MTPTHRPGASWRTAVVVLATLLTSGPTRAATIGADGLEAGGSNYFNYSVSLFPWVWENTALVYQPLFLRPVIGTLQYDPERVRAQLALMHDRGQRKIALQISFGPFYNRGLTMVDDVWAYSVASDNFELTPLHQENLRTFLRFVREIGYEEVQFRFGPEAHGHPAYWAQWDELQYQQNWNFLARARLLIESELAGSAVRTEYDIFPEGAGIGIGQSDAYSRRIWIDYSIVFGGGDAYSSIIGNPAQVGAFLTRYIQTMDSTGHRPSSYAVDVYNDAYEALRIVAGVLRQTGEIGKPVLIQEAYYNDALEYDEIMRARRDFGLNIRSIMQWPNSRHSGIPAFDRDFALEFSNYSPRPPAPVIDASPALCIMPIASPVCQTTVAWNMASAAFGVVTILGTIVSGGQSGWVVAPWMPQGPYEFALHSVSNAAPGPVVDRTLVYSIPTRGTLATSSPTNTCRLEPGRSTCSLELFWSIPDAYATLFSVRVNGTVWAYSVLVGHGILDGITIQNTSVELYAGDTRIDALVVRATPP